MSRWHINLLCIALGGLFLYDLVLYSDAVLFRRVSPLLFEGRASATLMAAPLLAARRGAEPGWAIDIHVSRTVVFHSATLVASGLFLLGLAAAGEIFRRSGAEWGYVAEICLIFGGVLAVAVLLTSGSARSHLRALIGRSFLQPSLRLPAGVDAAASTTLSAPESYIGLQTRAIRAIAEVVDSPGGVLFVRDPEDAAFRWAGSWNMPAATHPGAGGPSAHRRASAAATGSSNSIRRATADTPACQLARDAGGRPERQDWLAELPRSWLAVPLKHLGQLIGFVVVARPRAQFKLDREVFDLLRIVGREVASHVAEQRATQVLTDTRQLQDYSKRFAFVDPRHQERVEPAFDAAVQRRGPCRQSGVPARHAGDGAGLGRQDHAPADAAAGTRARAWPHDHRADRAV